MTVAFALDYIPRRMQELGFGNDYLVRWRHIQVDKLNTVIINSGNDLFLLIDPVSGMKVKSKAGIFDLDDFSVNEMQYEHRGKIGVVNTGLFPLMALFIQVIPKHIK
jgi:hypothetical protein